MKRKNTYKRKYKRMRGPFIMRLITYNHRLLDPEYCTCAEGIDISPKGLSFKYPRVLEKDDHIKVVIENIKGMATDEIIANVKIVWAATKDVLSKRFGARFVKIAPDKKYRLIKLVHKNCNVKNVKI